ncbi:putative toxin Y4kP [Bryobacterales bacterium F-183]|nr:putative toxin Y4kP [Bryobacterales bacterium F-183]
MSFAIRWSPRAARDLAGIAQFIGEDSADQAQLVAASIYERLSALANFPNIGRKGRLAGTRELVLAPLPFIVVYRVAETTIDVVRILHGAQKWP